MISPPAFWQDKDGAAHPAARILRPFASIYGWAGRRRHQQARPHLAAGPVICVGNVSMGGVGKTPFAIMLAEISKSNNLIPAFLTRGYGGSANGPLLVSAKQTPDITGDEALLLARHASTCISADRVAGAKMIFAGTNAGVLIMDDGFQNPSLKKNLSFVLVDAETGFGNGLVFPAGPLRETPAAAFERADAIVLVLPHKDFEVPPELLSQATTKPVFRAWLEPLNRTEQSTPVVAFCGIGRPQKFYQTAAATGYDIRATRDFADHYQFTEQDLTSLAALAAQHDASLLTTEKDFVRLPTRYRENVHALPVRMRVDKEQDLKNLLLTQIQKDSSA